MELTSLTIAIPAYNEEHTLREVVNKAIQHARLVSNDIEILIVNDGSTDTTREIAEQLKEQHSEVKVIHHKKNIGFTGAIKSCYRNATKQWVFLMPADGQIDSATLKAFVDKTKNTDVVVGYRLNRVESPLRQLNSILFHLLYKSLFQVPLREISTAILWKKKVLDSLSIRSKPRSAMIEPEVIYKAWTKGARFSEVGIPYHKRLGGKAKGAGLGMILLTLSEMFRLWWMLRVKK